MSGFSVFTADFTGLNGNGPINAPDPINIPGLKIGDIRIFWWRHGGENEDIQIGRFASVVTADDELNQIHFQDLSANTYTAVFLRFS